jgi:hypothetical protein
MAQDREFKFIVGVETSLLPATTVPTIDDDLVTKGFADEEYARLDSWADKVLTISALKAIAAANRFDAQSIFVKSQGLHYYFDSASVAAGDDDNIVEPDAGTGRWVKVAPIGDPAPVVWNLNGPVEQLYDTFDGWFRATGNRTLTTAKISANNSGSGTTTVEFQRWSGGPSGAGTATISLVGDGDVKSNTGAIALSLINGDMVRVALTAIALNLEDIRIEAI